MAKFKTDEEIARGVLSSSPIYPVAYEVRDRYLAGESVSEIAEAYRHLGVRATMVSSYLTKNKIKRAAEVVALAKEKRDEKGRQALAAYRDAA